MILAGGSFSDSHYSAARAIKDHIDRSFDRPCDQRVDRHGKEGGQFQNHAAGGRCCGHAFKGEQEQVGKPIDQGDDRTFGIGSDQLKSDAQRDHGFKDPKYQPDQLSGFKCEDALFPAWFSL